MARSFISKDEGVRILREEVPALVDAIRNIDNPDAPAIGIWTARDVAAHLIDAVEDHQNVALGKGTAVSASEEITEHNQKLVNERGKVDVAELAALFEKEYAAYLDRLAGVDGDPDVSWAGLTVPLSTVIAADIAEVLIHGYDITKAEGKPWRIDPYAAALSGRGVSPMAMDYVDKEAAAGLNACFDLRMRGQWQLHYVFADGDLSIEEPTDRKVDVHISADPVAFLLVAYGRIAQWGPIATGKIAAWGRKPWLAMRFGSLLRNP